MFYLSGALWYQLPRRDQDTCPSYLKKLKYFKCLHVHSHFYLNIDIFPDNLIKFCSRKMPSVDPMIFELKPHTCEIRVPPSPQEKASG